jgi:hypothetical protein
MGLAVPAGDTEAFRQTPESSETESSETETSETSAASGAAGSNVAEKARSAPSQHRALPRGDASAGEALIKALLLLLAVCIPGAWAFYLGRRPGRKGWRKEWRKPWRFARQQGVYLPRSAPTLRPVQSEPRRGAPAFWSRRSANSSTSAERSALSRRRRTIQDIMAWR